MAEEHSQVQFNCTKDLQTPSGEESVKSDHGRREDYGEKKLWKRVNFETRMEVLGGGNVDYGSRNVAFALYSLTKV